MASAQIPPSTEPKSSGRDEHSEEEEEDDEEREMELLIEDSLGPADTVPAPMLSQEIADEPTKSHVTAYNTPGGGPTTVSEKKKEEKQQRTFKAA
jgi:hypothetical protein